MLNVSSHPHTNSKMVPWVFSLSLSLDPGGQKGVPNGHYIFRIKCAKCWTTCFPFPNLTLKLFWGALPSHVGKSVILIEAMEFQEKCVRCRATPIQIPKWSLGCSVWVFPWTLVAKRVFPMGPIIFELNVQTVGPPAFHFPI